LAAVGTGVSAALDPFLPHAEKDRLMRSREVHEPRDFSKRGDALPVPNLVRVQQDSYVRFLQKEIDPAKRKPEGLESLLREVFPIESYDGNLRLE